MSDFRVTDPKIIPIASRSIRLDGQVTSIRLEGLYWSVLDDVAESQGFSTPELYQSYREVMDIARRATNLPHCCGLRA